MLMENTTLFNLTDQFVTSNSVIKFDRTLNKTTGQHKNITWEVNDSGELIYRNINKRYQIKLNDNGIELIGDVNFKINGDVKTEVFGNKETIVYGDYNLKVLGETTVLSEKEYKVESKKTLTIQGGPIVDINPPTTPEQHVHEKNLGEIFQGEGNGRYVIRLNGQIKTYNDYREIPQVFDNLLEFYPYVPRGPHTHEQHEEMSKWNNILKDILKRETNARSN